MHFNCRSFIGKNTPQFWSQTWENEPDSSNTHLFGLISLQSSLEACDLKALGREIIDHLNQSFFSQTDGDINQKLARSIESHIVDNPHQNIEINLILVVNYDQKIYLAVYGQNLAFLQRNSQISQLISGVQNQIFQISGPIKDNDRLLLTTADFVDRISWGKIKSTLIDSKLQNIEEAFLSDLYSFENQTNLSAFLIEIHSEDIVDDTSSPAPEIAPIPQTAKAPLISPAEPSITNITPPITFPSRNNQPEVYVKSRFKFKIGSHKRIQLLVALFLLIGLLVSSYFGYQKNQTQKAESDFQSLKSELETKFNNISVVKNLNLETTYQSAKEAQEIISKMLQLNIHTDEINQYKSQIDLILSQNGDSDSFKPESIYDTSRIINNPEFSKIFFSKNNLYLLDSTNGRIDSITPQEKSTKNVLISDQIKSSSKILVDNNNLYLLSQNQVSLIEKSGLTSKINIPDSVTITDTQFWNGSFYILDKNAQSIWKSTPSASGYSTPQSWLKNDAKLELGANSLSIDSQIWVLTESGRIFLYNSGIKSKFNQTQEINFTKATNLVTDVDSDFLVFSDNSKFIYVYKKNGEFAFKFNLGDLQVLDVAFDGPNKTIYFLASDQKIYKISL